MYCKKCAAQIDDDSIFCYKCGAQLVKVPSSAQNTTPQNNAPVNKVTPNIASTPQNNIPQYPPSQINERPTQQQQPYQTSQHYAPSQNYQPNNQQPMSPKPKSKIAIILAAAAVVVVFCIIVISVLIHALNNNRNNPSAYNGGYVASNTPNKGGSGSSSDNQANDNSGNNTNNTDDAKNDNIGNTEGNNSVSNDTPTPQKTAANADTKKDDMGYLTIKINGAEKSYKPQSEMSQLVGLWSVIFGVSTNSPDNSFFIELPQDVQSGDVYLLNSADINNSYIPLTPSEALSYCNSDGEQFFFGMPNGDMEGKGAHYSSKCTITITQWDGMGGYAYGTIEGDMYFSQNDVVHFTNGKFKVKIKGTGV